jgi:flagellar assembly protein FliH
MMQALEPLLSDMVGKVLPDLSRQALGPTIVELLMSAAREMAGLPVELTVSDETRPVVEPLVAGLGGLKVRVVTDPLLGPGQAFLRFADKETRVDLDAVVQAISRAVTAFFQMETEKERAVG